MKKEEPETDIVLKNGFIGYLEEGDIIYCNEKEYTGKGFLFKCVDGCIHNPLRCACGKEWKHTGEHDEPIAS